jgi:hypothetical protein
MVSCDYNGWNDAPEEEREWFDRHAELSLCSDAFTAAPMTKARFIVLRSAREPGHLVPARPTRPGIRPSRVHSPCNRRT